MTLTNKTILETLNKLRLQKSCELLQQTDLSIADVAAASGFRTPEYFHRFFLKQTKTTPRRYREAHP
jgi:AraC-like DNA-binding protein